MEAIVEKLKWGLSIFGVVMLALGIFGAVKSHETPVAYETLKVSDLKEGKMVEGDLPFNFGVYEEKYTTHYGIEDKSTKLWYYIIPIEEKYMGIAVNMNKDGARYDRQTNSTMEYIFDENAPEPASIHMKGVLSKMTDQEKGFFKEALIDGGFSASEADSINTGFYIKSDAYSDYIFNIILGAVCSLLGAGCFIFARKYY